MRGTRTIRRAGFALGLIGVAWCGLCPGCSVNHKPKKAAASRPASSQQPALDAASLENARPAVPAPMPSAIASTLQALHEQRLEIVPPLTPLQRLEFGPGRLLQASVDRVVLRETQQGEFVTEATLGAVLAVAHGSDGALFALGRSVGARFESRTKKKTAFLHAAFFPDSLLFPDLEQPKQFYVYYPSEQRLLRYLFEAEAGAFLPIEADVPLEGCTSPPTQLLDGALACRTAAGFARRAPRGARTDFKLSVELGQPFRLLPARRLDELYAVDRGGEVKRLRLSPGMPVLGAFQLPAPPYAAAANGEALAFILVSAPEPGQDRRWSLLVTDLEGQVRLGVDLPARAAPADEDWAIAVTEDKNLAISGFEPLVAVGGGTQVTAWDYRAGAARFMR